MNQDAIQRNCSNMLKVDEHLEECKYRENNVEERWINKHHNNKRKQRA